MQFVIKTESKIAFFSLHERDDDQKLTNLGHELNRSKTKYILAELAKYSSSDCMVFDNIGIKHVFLCINICWAARRMLKREPERRGSQPLPRCSADVNVSEQRV